MKNRTKKIIIISVLTLLIITEIYVLAGGKFIFRRYSESERSESQVPKTLSRETIVAEHNYWSKRMDEVGGQIAYLEFKRQYENKNFTNQHLGSHILGSLLYQKMGIAGQVICDSTFAFGCYHSFFSQALADKGPSVIMKLNQICLDKFGSSGTNCQHGIGHGLMDYYGPSRLLDALNACKPKDLNTEIPGCAAGVFMEYNVPVIINETSATVVSRTVDKKNPYAPCPGLPENFKRSCYNSIGQWWDQTTAYQGDWKTQGLLCKNVPESSYVEFCFMGVGDVTAPNNGFDPEKAIASCKKMPDQKSVIICRAGASWSFAANPKFKHLAVKMCADLSGSDKKECLSKGSPLDTSN